MNNKEEINITEEELFDEIDSIVLEVKNLKHFVQNDFERSIEDGIYDRNLVKEDMPNDIKNLIKGIKSQLDKWENDFNRLVDKL